MAKDWTRRNPERAKERDRLYRERNREKMAAKQKRHAERHPQKAKARNLVTVMVYQGRLEKPRICQDCDQEFEKHLLHGHHEDYSKPLDVDWLCRPCHRKRHST
jgi:hypothetical protein